MVGMLDSLSLKNTKLGLETLELMGYDPTKIHLVLNRAHSRVGISQGDVVAVLGREPDVYVPSDREIPRAVNEGVPIVVARPESDAAPRSASLADRSPARRPPRQPRDGRNTVPPRRKEGIDGTPRANHQLPRRRSRASAREPFADLKNQVHMQVISELGPQLTVAGVDPPAPRSRDRGHPPPARARDRDLTR